MSHPTRLGQRPTPRPVYVASGQPWRSVVVAVVPCPSCGRETVIRLSGATCPCGARWTLPETTTTAEMAELPGGVRRRGALEDV